LNSFGQVFSFFRGEGGRRLNLQRVNQFISKCATFFSSSYIEMFGKTIYETCDRRGKIVTPAWPPTTGTSTSLGWSPRTSACEEITGESRKLINDCNRKHKSSTWRFSGRTICARNY
jgi:hypothetical protein